MTATEPVLLPYQQRWVDDSAPVKVIEKTRRGGLSWAEASDNTLYAASQSGDDVWYISYNKDMAEEFIKDVAAWARYYQLAAGAVEQEVLKDEGTDILIYKVRFASGHTISALSSRPTNLRGKQGIVVIDEAAFHNDLAGLLKSALAVLMWGGKVRIISTHNGDINPFNQLVEDCRAKRKPYSLHRVTFREAVKQGLYRRICLKLNRQWTRKAERVWIDGMYEQYGDDAAEELDVIPSSGSGIWLPTALIQVRMVECQLIEVNFNG